MIDRVIGGPNTPKIPRSLKPGVQKLQKFSEDYGELQRRATHIFPLMRLDRIYGEECHLKEGTLVFLEPCDLRKSYVYNFCAENVLRDEKGKAIPVKIQSEVACFDCYHREKTEGFSLASPSADEVLSQIPENINWQKGYYAFVIEFDGVSNDDFYYPAFKVHRTRVHLYQLKGKLPKELVTQPVIIDWQIINVNREGHG